MGYITIRVERVDEQGNVLMVRRFLTDLEIGSAKFDLIAAEVSAAVNVALTMPTGATEAPTPADSTGGGDG